jgi:hypothetical protein
LKRRVKLKGHRLGVDMSCSRGFIVALLHRFDFLEYVWQGGSLERNLNAGIVRRAVVGYSAPLISVMVCLQAWCQWAAQCPPCVFSALAGV